LTKTLFFSIETVQFVLCDLTLCREWTAYFNVNLKTCKFFYSNFLLAFAILSLRMNKKLIRCLGNEVLSIFELSKTMGDQKKEEFEFVRDQTESLRMIPLSKIHTPSIFNR